VITTTPVDGEILVDGETKGFGSVTLDIGKDVFPGSHIVSFGDVENYTTPESHTVNIVADENASAIGKYTICPLAGLFAIVATILGGFCLTSAKQQE
jgi:hypothetical protein